MKFDDEEYRQFVKGNPPIDEVREEAARVCEETARWERGERPKLRYGAPGQSEFSDGAFGVAAEVAFAVSRALFSTGKKFKPDLAWASAAVLLRAGYKRGQQIVAQELGQA